MHTPKASFPAMLLQAAIELLIAFPLVILTNHWFIDFALWQWTALLLSFYCAGFLIAKLLPLQVWVRLIAAAICFSFFVVYVGFGLSITGIAVGLIGFYLFIRGTLMAYRVWKSIFSTNNYWIGLLLYFIVSVFFHFLPNYKVYSPLLIWLCLLSMIITLLVISQERIILESLPEKDGSHLVNNRQLWHSRYISIILIAIIVIIAAFDQLTQWFTWLNHWFWTMLHFIGEKIAKFFETSPDKPQQAAAEPTPPPLTSAPAEQSQFMKWLQEILLILVNVLLVAVFLFAVFMLIKWFIKKALPRIMLWLKEKMRQSDVATDIGFEDESTRLTTFKDLLKSYKANATDWLDRLRQRELKWSELQTNTEKIRYLYRLVIMRSLKKGSKIDTHLTAREMISSIHQSMPELLPASDKLASLYNQARYSDHSIKDEELNQLSKEIKPE